jgi:hypothetical protein
MERLLTSLYCSLQYLLDSDVRLKRLLNCFSCPRHDVTHLHVTQVWQYSRLGLVRSLKETPAVRTACDWQSCGRGFIRFQTCILANRNPRNMKIITVTLKEKDDDADGHTKKKATRVFPTYAFRLTRDGNFYNEIKLNPFLVFEIRT